jgi:hypothetical protein
MSILSKLGRLIVQLHQSRHFTTPITMVLFHPILFVTQRAESDRSTVARIKAVPATRTCKVPSCFRCVLGVLVFPFELFGS